MNRLEKGPNINPYEPLLVMKKLSVGTNGVNDQVVNGWAMRVLDRDDLLIIGYLKVQN